MGSQPLSQQPQSSETEKHSSANQPNKQPPKTALAIKLLFGSVLIGVIFIFINGGGGDARISPTAAITIQLISVALVGLVVWLISRRKNWARMLFLIMFVSGAPLTVMPLLQSFSQMPATAILSLVQTVIQLAGLILLFLPESSAWFKGIPQEESRADSPE